MASYQDAITTFNPYVSQLPIEEMVKVGMTKQAQYEQGYQKIQSQIDQVSGLDLVRGVDKNYLQSKLDELGNNLKSVAAGDFSNFQLVNSVGGMTKQISKDETVQNSVASTAWYRKQQAAIEAAKKQGKSSLQNEAWFNESTKEWFNDPNAGSKFTGEYVPYTDLNKKWRDIQKEFGATGETTVDLPYLQDSKGRYIDEKGNLLPPDAKPVVNEVMIEKVFKGKSPQAVKQAIMASMNENDIRQLKIDGWYHYKDVSPEGLKDIADNKTKEHIDDLNKQLSALNTLKSLNVNNSKYQAAISDQISEVNNDYKKTMSDHDSTLNLISKNPNEYRSQIYSQHALNEFANNFSNYSETIKYVDNPYITKRNKDREYSLAIDNYKENQRHNKADESIGWYKATTERKRLDWEKDKAAKDEEKDKALLEKGAITKDLQTDITKTTEKLFIEDLDNQKKTLDGFQADFMKNYKDDSGKPFTPETFKKEYAFHFDKWNSGVEVDGKWKNFFDAHGDLEKTYNRSAALLVSCQNQANEELKKDPLYKAAVVKAQNQLNAISGGKPIVLKDVGGQYTKVESYDEMKGYTLSPSDMAKRITSGKASIFINETSFNSGIGYYDSERGIKIWIPRDAAYGEETTRTDPWSSNLKHREEAENTKMYNQLLAVAQYSNVHKKINQTVAEKTGDILSKKSYTWQPTAYDFKDKNKSFVSAKFNDLVSRISTEKGKQETDPFTKDYDQTTSQTLALNEGTKFGATRVGNTVYLTMSGKVGDKAVAPQAVKITASEYQKAFNESIISPVQEVSDLIYQNGNTNPESQISYDGILKHPEHAQTTAYFSKKKGSSRDNFPRIQKYNVKADIIVMPDGSNYQTAFYIQVPNKNGEKEWIVRTSEQSSDLNALVKGLVMMDDNSIEKTLK